MSLGDASVHCDDCRKKVAVKTTWIVGKLPDGSLHVVCEECSKKYSSRHK